MAAGMLSLEAPDVAAKTARLRIRINGAVQGVGFRPFVYRLAQGLHVSGFVRNTTQGLLIEVEGSEEALRNFVHKVKSEHPQHASLHTVFCEEIAPRGSANFVIHSSDSDGELSLSVLPDLALCPACLHEMNAPQDHRYRYPFINCTDCGPRFSILTALPYDRPNTSMRSFEMCPRCRTEYEDPLNRRFHAQPVACPECGPQIALWDAAGRVLSEKEPALLQAAALLREGKILAVKGLGGFHLMIDARNDAAVQRLRLRKHREEKPFALMFPDLECIKHVCMISPMEEELLLSSSAPIVLAKRKAQRAERLSTFDTQNSIFDISFSVAPNNPYLGVMLPYTPLHHLLMKELRFPVVATSGNRSDEPIVTDEGEAVHRLRGIADAFLVHNRPIVRHTDDSIVRVLAGAPRLLRRARGYAPLPISIGMSLPPILAVGGHLKNTVAFARDNRVFLSQHIGDLDMPEAVAAFEQVIRDLQQLLGFRPQAVACDLHPDYASTQFARKMNLPLISVQHHYAHVVSNMAENNLEGTVLGIAWDGAGYGSDGAIWGGEFLLSDLTHFNRAAHLRTFPLPGGDRVAREGWRCALGVLHEIFGEKTWQLRSPALEPARPFAAILKQMLARGVNAPRTSSAGRLFDAVAALTNIAQTSTFEGQAAMMVEFACLSGRPARPPVGTDEWATIQTTQDSYPFQLTAIRPAILDWEPMIRQILDELENEVPAAEIAAKFHNTLVEMMVAVARHVNMKRVVLTGGCFQNRLLTERAVARLQAEGFTVFLHQQVPPGDGGLALGQAVAAGLQLSCDEVKRHEIY